MSSKIKLAPTIRIGFGMTFALMVGIGKTSWLTMRRLNETNRLVSNSHEAIGSLHSLEKAIVATETKQLQFVMTQQGDFLDPYADGKLEVEAQIAQVEELTLGHPTQRENLEALQQLIAQDFAELDDRVALREQNREAELMVRMTFGNGKRTILDIQAAIAKMIELEERLLASRHAATESIARWAALVSIGGTSGAVALGVLLLVFISRKVVEPIGSVVQQLDGSSSEIAATVEQQEQAVRNQAAIANQTSTTMNELSASSRQSAEQAEAAAAGARSVLMMSEGGAQAVERTLEGMVALREKVAEIAMQISNLSDRANQIGAISGLVSDLANQTNMLALNAAVEAVRAGENGKGFSVVSQEIRKLADRSKGSADRINALVQDIQAAIGDTVAVTEQGTQTVEEGVQIAEETSQAFSGVTDAVDDIVLSSQQISLNAKQQASAIQEILTAMTSLNQAAQETATGIGQVRSGTNSLSDAAVLLKKIV